MFSFLAIQTYFRPEKATPPAIIAPLTETGLISQKEIPPSLLSALDIPFTSNASEEFYVLENATQQLVFSTKGGSLAEINLPLRSTTHPTSLVKEIDIDRQILANSPSNARFPLYPYYTPSAQGTVRNAEGALGGYYPLLRRNLLRSDGSTQSQIPSEYYALTLIGEGERLFRVVRFESDLIQFESTGKGRKIRKTYSIPKEKNGPYCLQLDLQIEGEGDPLWITSGLPDVELLAGSYSPLLKYQSTRNKQSEVEEISLPKDSPLIIPDSSPNWISNCNGFLGIILDPLSPILSGYQVQKVSGEKVPTRLSLIDASHSLYSPSNYPAYATSLPLKNNSSTQFRIFAGPFDETLLQELDALYEDPLQGYNPEYTLAQSIQGWFSFISQPFATFLFFLMQLFYSITSSWALSIVLLTIALKAMTYPLNNWSLRATVKMQQIQPLVKALQERYKKDPKRAQLETINLYREKGANPFSGCLPMLLQTPFLFGMFYLLKSSFPLRGALFIPGWIDNLAAPDVLFRWNPPLFWIGNEFHLLPFFVGATMLLQQKLSWQADTQSADEQQKKIMGIFFSLFLIAMFYSLPSGLNLYFLFSSLLGILQQWYMMRKLCTPGNNS